MESIKQVLMRRDGLTAGEADDLIEEAKAELMDLIENDDPAAHGICEEWFGLEADYLMELL